MLAIWFISQLFPGLIVSYATEIDVTGYLRYGFKLGCSRIVLQDPGIIGVFFRRTPIGPCLLERTAGINVSDRVAEHPHQHQLPLGGQAPAGGEFRGAVIPTSEIRAGGTSIRVEIGVVSICSGVETHGCRPVSGIYVGHCYDKAEGHLVVHVYIIPVAFLDGMAYGGAVAGEAHAYGPDGVRRHTRGVKNGIRLATTAATPFQCLFSHFLSEGGRRRKQAGDDRRYKLPFYPMCRNMVHIDMSLWDCYLDCYGVTVNSRMHLRRKSALETFINVSPRLIFRA